MVSKKVLLVDDEIDFLTLMSKRIESWGYEVLTASNAVDAVDIFRKDRPQAIVLDYMMPDMNGIDLLRKIRSMNRRVPVIMFTAQPTFKAIEGGTELSVAAFIPKESALIDTEKDLEIALDLVFKRI